MVQKVFKSLDGSLFNSFREAKLHDVEIKNTCLDIISDLRDDSRDFFGEEKGLLFEALNKNFTKERAWQFCLELALIGCMDHLQRKEEKMISKMVGNYYLNDKRGR